MRKDLNLPEDLKVTGIGSLRKSFNEYQSANKVLPKRVWVTEEQYPHCIQGFRGATFYVRGSNAKTKTEWVNYTETKYLAYIPVRREDPCQECGHVHYYWEKKGVFPYKKIRRKRKKTVGDYGFEILRNVYLPIMEEKLFTESALLKHLKADKSNEGEKIPVRYEGITNLDKPNENNK